MEIKAFVDKLKWHDLFHLLQVIYVGFIIYFFVRMVKLLHKQKLQYFKDFWNMLEFSTMIMSIITVAMYGMKMVFGNVAMNVVKESGSGIGIHSYNCLLIFED